jgi:hypothetical protein
MSGVHSNFPKSFLAFDVPGYLAQLKKYDGKARPGGGVYSFADAAPVWNPLESYRVTERTVGRLAAGDLSGERWNADVGRAAR